MKNIIFVSWCIVCTHFIGMSQGSLEGQLIGEGEPLAFATVMLLNPTDSVMTYFTQTSTEGYFQFDTVDQQAYLLQITYMGYKPHWQTIDMRVEPINLGQVHMTASADMLTTIEVTGELIPMKIGDDTVVYNTAAFPTLPGEVVEDLLKKMPGIEVERDGSVKAFGETVQNVLVDGKEFFGKDTRIATKNLDAEAIEKVEVFDKQSDQATFTGIADGREERSINLELKEDFKKGYFGNIEAGGGTDERFASKATINRFLPAQRLSFIGLGNNVNEQGFSMQDYFQFMGGLGALTGGRRNINIPLSLHQQSGIQRTWAGGINVDQDFSSRTSLNINAFYSDSRNDLNSATHRNSLGQSSLFNADEENLRLTKTQSLVGNMRFKTELDSMSDLTARAAINFGSSGRRSTDTTTTYETGLAVINAAQSNYAADTEGDRISGSLIYRRRFGKPGRTLVLEGSYGHENNDADGTVQSQHYIYFPNNVNEHTNQIQDSRLRAHDVSGRLVLTERISSRHALEWNAFIGNTDTDFDNFYYDIESPGTLVLNDQLSIGYSLRNRIYDAGMRWSFQHKKYTISAGANFQDARLEGRLQGSDDAINQQSSAVLPSVFIRSRGQTNGHISLEYHSNLIQPTIQQLRPTIDNRNPLNIYRGNPDLTAAKRHAIRFSYMNYDAFYFRLIQFRCGLEYTKDQITDVVQIDNSLRRIVTPINVADERSMSGKIEFSNPIKPLGIMAKISLGGRYGRSILSINGALDNMNRINSDIRFSIENRKRDVVDASVGVAWRRNTTKYAVDKSLDQVMDERRIFADVKLKIGKAWDLRSDVDYTQFSQNFNASNTTIPIWKASVTRYFTERRKLKLTFSVHDLLNRNNGIATNSDLNYSTYTTSNVLGRYAMLTLSYNVRGFQNGNNPMEVRIGGN